MRKNPTPSRRMALRSLGAATIALACAASAAHAADEHDHDHDHGDKEHSHEPRYGGIVVESGGVDFELVLKPDAARLYVSDHGTKMSAKGGKATITFLKDGASTKLVLLPAGEDYFEVKGAVPTGKGVRAVAVVLLKGKTMSVRFVQA